MRLVSGSLAVPPVLPKNHPANMIIRHLSDGQIQLRSSDIKDISSYYFFFFLSCCWFSFRAPIPSFSDLMSPFADAKAPLLCDVSASENTVEMVVAKPACPRWVNKRRLVFYRPAYMTNLKWQVWEVRAFNQAGAQWKQYLKRAKISPLTLKWAEEKAQWLRMTAAEKTD